MGNKPSTTVFSMSCLFASELKKMPLTAIGRNFCLKLNERKARIRKIYCSMDVINFLRSICKKKPVPYILKLCPKIGQSIEESLRRGKLLKNLKTFSMNDKTITEFGFRMM